MMSSLDGGRRRSLALVVLAVAALSPAGEPVASAQVEEPVPAVDSHPAEERPRTPGAELGKDAAPTTTVMVGEDEGGLIQAYTIEFGDEKDWVQLASGEWLRGNIERMRDGSMEFNSDEIKLITYDWKKVRELHSPRANSYNFSDGTDLVGPAMINEEFVVVRTVDWMVTRPRAELSAIIEHTRRERNYWSTVLRLGLTANAGNTENLTFNAFWQLVREDTFTRAAITYDGTFGTASRAEVANRHLAGGDVDIFVHPIIYVKALTGQLLYDKFQNIRLRATPAAGLGFHLITTYVVNWDLEFAPAGYQYLSLIDPAAAIENPQNDAYMMFRMFADLDFTDDIQLLLEWRTNLVYTTIGNTNHVGNLDFTVRVTTLLHTNISFLYLRTEQPFPRSDGTIPKQNDYQFVFGISLRIG